MSLQYPVIYSYSVTLTTNQNLPDQGVVTDPDSLFEFMAIAGYASAGAYSLRFRLPDERYFCNQYMRSDLVVGTGQFPVSLPEPVIYQPRARLSFDLFNDIAGANNSIQIAFIGRRIYPS